MTYKAAIIGLGNIGSLFDEDSRRKDVSSHAGAYLVSTDVEIDAAADPDKSKLERFSARCPGVKLYTDYKDMLAGQRLDIISVCSPTNTHFEIVSDAAKYDIRAIFCEKPIASRVEDGHSLVELCGKKAITLAVNHSRRCDRNYIRIKEYITQGEIGEITSITGIYPDKVYMVGLPGENMQSIYDTTKFLVDNEIECGPFFVTPYPETGLFYRCEKEILSKFGSLEDFVIKCEDDVSLDIMVN